MAINAQYAAAWALDQQPCKDPRCIAEPVSKLPRRLPGCHPIIALMAFERPTVTHAPIELPVPSLCSPLDDGRDPGGGVEGRDPRYSRRCGQVRRGSTAWHIGGGRRKGRVGCGIKICARRGLA